MLSLRLTWSLPVSESSGSGPEGLGIPPVELSRVVTSPCEPRDTLCSNVTLRRASACVPSYPAFPVAASGPGDCLVMRHPCFLSVLATSRRYCLRSTSEDFEHVVATLSLVLAACYMHLVSCPLFAMIWLLRVERGGREVVPDLSTALRYLIPFLLTEIIGWSY
jgi:hypothetical protein